MINFIQLWEDLVGDSGKAPTDEELTAFGQAIYNLAYEEGHDDGYAMGYDEGYPGIL